MICLCKCHKHPKYNWKGYAGQGGYLDDTSLRNCPDCGCYNTNSDYERACQKSCQDRCDEANFQEFKEKKQKLKEKRRKERKKHRPERNEN